MLDPQARQFDPLCVVLQYLQHLVMEDDFLYPYGDNDTYFHLEKADFSIFDLQEVRSVSRTDHDLIVGMMRFLAVRATSLASV